MKLALPEVDMDQYSLQMQVSANDYAVNKATEFLNCPPTSMRNQKDKGTATSSSSNQVDGENSFTGSLSP